MKLAYILRDFPKLSETFIYEEIYQLIIAGEKLLIYSLVELPEEVQHEKLNFILSNTSVKTYSISYRSLFQNNIISLDCISQMLVIIYNVIINLFFSPILLFRTPDLFFRINIRKLYKDLKRDYPDHIHTHFIFSRAELVTFLSRKIGVPFTITTHAKDIYIPNIKRIKRVAQSAKKIIAISQFNKNLLISYGIPRNKICVVHCGIDTEVFFPVIKARNEILQILSIGRFVEKKGFIYLLEAANLLVNDECDTFHIDIIGEGPLESELLAYVKLNQLQKFVTFHGIKKDIEVKSFLSSCDTFVLPCIIAKDGDMDGIPVVLMEALAMGKPVISSNISGIPELIKDKENGFLIPEKDAMELKNKLKNFNWRKKVNLSKEFISKYEVKKLRDLFHSIFSV